MAKSLIDWLSPFFQANSDKEDETTWPQAPRTWPKTSDLYAILHEDKQATPPPTTLAEIMANSLKFPRKFPVESMLFRQLETKVDPKILQFNANSVYPVLHESALYLCALFLSHQRQYGAKRYGAMSLLQLVDRLLTKRAVTFVGYHDSYILIDGSTGVGGWEKVGTAKEKPPLLADACLTYDEMKLSALLSVSSHTVFINEGHRSNKGVYEENREKVQDGGVIIGLVGTRLPKELVMEYREVVKSEEQNTPEHGFGNSSPPSLQRVFLDFYGDAPMTFKELQHNKIFNRNKKRFVNLKDNTEYFDCLMFNRRIALSIDTLLIEANDRAKKMGTMAYVHVVGLGLGVWKIYQEQDRLFMDTFATRLEFLGAKLKNISDVRFAYIQHNQAGKYRDGDKVGHIKLHMCNDNPHKRLRGEDEGKLLVVSYAWDGNSLPGNEFWGHSLASSSDPAAACSTQVTEIHNAHINPQLCAANLRIATLDGLVTFGEYQAMHQND